ncbi:uncharacterized protein LOC115758539 [Drosophila novamexicana]|uniref:uncharacterized protein LOC115758539 n=1 Tax=Drosophila novamexicana TaxID=47314 RepID=UPI0011E5E874|nr:uncharacterized protein LOC115758539 [Drosophila novamexicana]
MLTKQPDYTISELGYPQLYAHSFYKKCRPQEPCFRSSCTHSPSHSPSPNRLLPLRETLDDYNKRLLGEQAENCETSRGRDLDDRLAQQKRQKNLWNEQQKQQQQRDRRNQKCRDKAQAKRPTTKATLVTCDLNSF